MAKHALLSASGSDRWINCTPSAKLEAKIPSQESKFADEGTLAHSFAELILKFQLYDLDFEDELKDLKKSELYNPEMDDYVSAYVIYVLETFNEMAKDNPLEINVILLEKEVNFSNYVKKGFGTSDVVIISGNHLHIIDLKYGKGVPVSAVNNSQLKLYALGALNLVEGIIEIEKVSMSIVQPRLDSISVEEINVTELKSWGDTIRIKAEKAFKGKGEFKVGKWCTFCKIRNTCRALHDQNLEIMKHDFAEPNELNSKELEILYLKSADIIKWLNSVRKHVLSLILKGEEFEHLKAVEGRSSRILINKEELQTLLIKKGFTIDQIMKSDLVGLGKLEQLIGKKDFAIQYENFIAKTSGKPTIVSKDDPRPAFTDSDFVIEEDEDELI